MGFSWQECWSGLPWPPPGDLPSPGTEPPSLMSPAVAGGFFTISIVVVAVVIQLPNYVWHFETLWTAACQASLSYTISRSLPKLMSIALVIPSSHPILSCPLLLLPSIFPSIRVFSNMSAVLIRWPKYWRFSFSISPSNKYSGLTSLKIDWFDLLAVQGIFRSLL